MSETATQSNASSLRLVGVEFAPTNGRQADSQRDAQLLQRALESETVSSQALPQPRLPMVPVYKDASGQQFILEQTLTGAVVLPYVSGSPLDANLSNIKQGGFAALTDLQRMAGVSAQLNGGGFTEVNALNEAALRLAANGGPNPSGSQPCALDGLLQAGAGGLAQQILTMSATSLAHDGNLQDMLNIVASKSGAELTTKAGIDAAKQLAGLASQMYFSETWSVDDESKTAEHVAHKYAQELVNELQGELIDQAAAALGLGDAPADLIARIKKFFGANPNPMYSAIRQGDVEDKGNPVIGPCSPDVVIEGLPAARLDDPVKPPGTKLLLGSATVEINKKVATRRLDTISLVHGRFPKAAAKTFIGGSATASENKKEDPPPPPDKDPRRKWDPDRGWSSVPGEAPNLSLPDWLRDIFCAAEDGSGLFGIQERAGNWYLLGGLIDLGSPEFPGAGTGFFWWVPDRIFAWDMSDYFVYHDKFYYNDVTLGDIAKILGHEGRAFAAGFKPDPIQIILQIIYSTATTAVGLSSATISSLQELFRIHGGSDVGQSNN